MLPSTMLPTSTSAPGIAGGNCPLAKTGTFGAACPRTTPGAIISSKPIAAGSSRRGIRISALWNDNCVSRLQHHVLLHVSSLNHLLVVERDPYARAVRHRSQDIDLRFLRKILKPARFGDRVQHRHGLGQWIRTWPHYFAHHVELVAPLIAHDHGYFRILDVRFQPFR